MGGEGSKDDKKVSTELSTKKQDNIQIRSLDGAINDGGHSTDTS